MTIQFACERCGHHLRAESAHAGRRARCGKCGHTVRIPGESSLADEPSTSKATSNEPEFRLNPIDHEPEPPTRPVTAKAKRKPEPEIGLEPIDEPEVGTGKLKLDRNADAARPGSADNGILEDLLADRSPIPIDTSYEPAPHSKSKGEPPWAVMAARARMYRTVRFILKKIEGFENWLYVISLIFLMVAITGLLLEYRPLAHFGAVWVTVTSILLAALGGIQVIITPFQKGIFGTSWKTMRKEIRNALGAFIPLIVLIASYFLIKPIRDYFLGTAEARQAKQMSSFSAPAPEPLVPPVIDLSRDAAGARA